MQTYPGLEINTSIATVGYYGGTSPGVVLVSAQHATLVRYYGQNETTTVSSSTFSCRTHPQQQHWLISEWNGGLQGLGCVYWSGHFRVSNWLYSDLRTVSL